MEQQTVNLRAEQHRLFEQLKREIESARRGAAGESAKDQSIEAREKVYAALAQMLSKQVQ